MLFRRRSWRAAALAGFFAAASPAQDPPREAGDVPRDYFSDLPLVTQEGKAVRFYSDVLKDRVVLIHGFFTSCKSIGPRQLAVLSQLQELLGDRLGRDVFIVSITIDPNRDTADKVKEYADALHPRPGWVFLTGKREHVDWVNYRLGQYEENVDDHRGVYLLGNVKTRLWMKAPLHAQAIDLFRGLQRLLRDPGEPEK